MTRSGGECCLKWHTNWSREEEEEEEEKKEEEEEEEVEEEEGEEEEEDEEEEEEREREEEDKWVLFREDWKGRSFSVQKCLSLIKFKTGKVGLSQCKSV